MTAIFANNRYVTPALSTITDATTIGYVSRPDIEFKKDSIICIIEGRGNARGEIGIAAFDRSTSTFIISQYIDDLTYSRTINKIEYFEPDEVVMLRKNDNAKNDLTFVLNKTFKSLKLTKIERKSFNSNEELKNILKLCCEQFKSIEQDIADKYYCIAATHFLINFIEINYSIEFKNKTLKITYSPIEMVMNIDPKTAKALEILTNQVNSKESIFSILNKTHTINGSRMLKKCLIEPLIDDKSIKTRLDCVQELVSSPELFEEIETVLTKLDKINVTSIVISFLFSSNRLYPREDGEKKIDNLMKLKNVLESVEPVKSLLKKCDNYLFRSYSKQLDDNGFREMLTVINYFFRDDCRYNKNHPKSYLKFELFKDRTLPQLDLIKKLLKTDISKIRALVTDLNDKYKLSMTYRYNRTRKFYFLLSIEEFKKMSPTQPCEFYNFKQAGKTMQFTNEELDRINLSFDRCLDTFFKTCNTILNDPIDEIRKYIFCIYKFVDIISTIDLLQSFAKVSAKYGWTKPTFREHLILQECVHPFHQLRDNKPVSNDFCMSKYSNIAIITGPNNSGKTTFIKQLLICQLLGQIGCFVPCQIGKFKIMDRLFARMGSDNDFDSNSSSFVNELKEISYILNNHTGKSLIAIDELGRGTSAEEGWPFCWSIIEKFIIEDNFILFATHYKELTVLAYHYLNIEIYYMETIEYELEGKEMLRFTHKIKQGVNQIEAYGIKLAEQTNMPRYVIDEARKIRDKLPTTNTYYKYLNSRFYRKRKKEYETGQLLLRYYELASKNPDFDLNTAVTGLLENHAKSLENIKMIKDNLTAEELISLGEEVEINGQD